MAPAMAGALTVIAEAFTGIEGGAAVGELDDERGIHFPGGFQRGVDRVRAGAVDRREGKTVRLGIGEDFLDIDHR